MDLGLEEEANPAREQGGAPAKRMAVGGTSSELNKHVVLLSKLVMNNSMNVRHIQGAIFETWRLPVSSEFVIAMKEATRLHADAMKQAGNTAAKADQLGPPHLHAWNSILKTLKAKNGSMTEPERQMLDAYIKEVTPGGWKGLQDQVKYCRVRKTYDKDYHNFDLMIQPGTLAFQVRPLLFKLLAMDTQAKLLPGHAAMGALERGCQAWLDEQTK